MLTLLTLNNYKFKSDLNLLGPMATAIVTLFLIYLSYNKNIRTLDKSKSNLKSFSYYFWM